MQEVKDKRSELLNFVLNSCMKADNMVISLQQHFDDAREFLTPLKVLLDFQDKTQLDFLNHYKSTVQQSNSSQEYFNQCYKQFRTEHLVNNNEYQTARADFFQVHTKFTNEVRDEEHSVVKKIINLYEKKDMNFAEIKFISGFLERYIKEGEECIGYYNFNEDKK